MDADTRMRWRRFYARILTVRWGIDAIAARLGADIRDDAQFDVLVELFQEQRRSQ